MSDQCILSNQCILSDQCKACIRGIKTTNYQTSFNSFYNSMRRRRKEVQEQHISEASLQVRVLRSASEIRHLLFNHWGQVSRERHKSCQNRPQQKKHAQARRNRGLRITEILAEDAASPPGLIARQVYLAEWVDRACRTLRQHDPLILVMTYSGELSTLSSSLNQDTVGDGMPTTWHSRTSGAPSATSTDLMFLVNSGGTICWCVSVEGHTHEWCTVSKTTVSCLFIPTPVFKPNMNTMIP